MKKAKQLLQNDALVGVVSVGEIKIFLEKTIKFIELQRDFIAFVKRGDLAKAREALAYNVSADTSDDNAKSALNYAAKGGNVELMKLLIELGAKR